MATYNQPFNHCRFCRADSYNTKLFQYGIRHHCCAPCGFKRWGGDFLEKLPVHLVQALPFRVCLDNGWSIQRLGAYVEKRMRDGFEGRVTKVRK